MFTEQEPTVTQGRMGVLLQSATGLPGSLDFVVKSAEEALEKATSDAKIEVEAYIGSVAQRIGLKSINQLAQLEDKS